MEYSWSSFGREAEYVVALYLKSAGWNDVRLSPGSRGPADIIASSPSARWFIQVKASGAIPRLKSDEMRRLQSIARAGSGLAVVATLQPFNSGAFSTGNFALNFYEIDSWNAVDPVLATDSEMSRAEPAKITDKR